MEFKKDLAWFQRFLPCIDGAFMTHEDTRTSIALYADACTSGGRVTTDTEAYHLEFPPYIIQQGLSIYHLEALHAMAALNVWTPTFTKQPVHLFSDNCHFSSWKREGPFNPSMHQGYMAYLCSLGCHPGHGPCVRDLSHFHCGCPQ